MWRAEVEKGLPKGRPPSPSRRFLIRRFVVRRRLDTRAVNGPFDATEERWTGKTHEEGNFVVDHGAPDGLLLHSGDHLGAHGALQLPGNLLRHLGRLLDIVDWDFILGGRDGQSLSQLPSKRRDLSRSVPPLADGRAQGKGVRTAIDAAKGSYRYPDRSTSFD